MSTYHMAVDPIGADVVVVMERVSTAERYITLPQKCKAGTTAHLEC